MLATLLSSAGNHALLKGPVGDETLDLVYGGVCVVVGAVALKLAGMRAIAAAGRGEGFAALDKPVGALCLPAANALRGGRFGNTGHDFHAVLSLHVHVEVAAVTGIIYVEHSKLVKRSRFFISNCSCLLAWWYFFFCSTLVNARFRVSVTSS